MKPSDVYALPALDDNPWHHAPKDMLLKVFGLREWEIWQKGCREQGDEAGRVRFQRKMTHVFSEDRHASVYSLTLDGQPFGVYVCDLGGAKPADAFFHSDERLLARAVSHVQQWRNRFVGGFSAPDQDMRGLEYLGEVGIAKAPEGYRLVESQFVGDGEYLVFDEKRHFDVLGEHCGPYWPTLADKTPMLSNPKTPEFRRIAAQCILASIPEGLKSVLVDDIEDHERGSRHGMWIAAAVGTDRSTYLIGVMPDDLGKPGFHWANNLACSRCDGPGYIDDLAEKYADRQPPRQPQP